MRHKKINAIIVSISFMLQIVFPAYAFSESSETSRSLPSVFTANAAFGGDLEKSERDLISSYIDYVFAYSKARKELRNAQTGLNNYLASNDIWTLLNIEDKETQSILDDLKSTNKFLVKELTPIEEKLASEESKLEGQFVGYINETNQGKRVSGSLMELARSLDGLYKLHDKIWEIKNPLVARMNREQKEIYHSYLSRRNDFNKAVLKRTELRTKVLNGLLFVIGFKEERIEDIKNEYKQAERKYNEIETQKILIEKEKSNALIREIQKQIEHLRLKGGRSEIDHAVLLERIVEVIKYRIRLIDEMLSSIENNKASERNFLYLSRTIGDYEKTKTLCKKYRKILSGFVRETEKRVNLARKIREHICEITEILKKEQILLANVFRLPKGSGKAGMQTTRSKEDISTNEFIESLSSAGNEIDEVLSLARDIDFSQPKEIIEDFSMSSTVVRINELFGDIHTRFETVFAYSFRLDSHLAEMLGKEPDAKIKQSPGYRKLQQLNSSRRLKIRALSASMEELSQSYGNDAKLSVQLRILGSDIVRMGNRVFSDRIASLTNALEREKQASGNPYYEFMVGLNEHLRIEHEFFSSVTNFFPKKIDENCILEQWGKYGFKQTLWHDDSTIGYDLASIFIQIKGLSSIEKFWGKDAVFSRNIYSKAEDLFEISMIINKLPILELHEDSIDVVFKIGNKTVAIRGIGTPLKVNLGNLSSDEDFFISTPYIGFSFNPKAAWESVKGNVSRVWEGTKWVAGKTWDGAKWTMGKEWNGTKWIAEKTWDGTEWTLGKTDEGAKWTMRKYWDGTKWVGEKTVDTTALVAEKTFDGATSVVEKYWDGTKWVAKKTLDLTKLAVHKVDERMPEWKTFKWAGGKARDGVKKRSLDGVEKSPEVIRKDIVSSVRHGNWCGKYWGAGKELYDKYGNKIELGYTDWCSAYEDDIDEVCRRHDYAYQWDTRVKVAADMDLINDLEELSDFNLTEEQKNAKDAILDYFVFQDRNWNVFWKEDFEKYHEVMDNFDAMISHCSKTTKTQGPGTIVGDGKSEKDSDSSGTLLPGQEEVEKKPTPEKLSPGKKHSPGEKYSPGPLYSPGELQKTPW